MRKLVSAAALLALALLPSAAHAEGAHGTIGIAGSGATFHVTAPPKECEQGVIEFCNWSSWYADAYADVVSDHCAAPDPNDIVAVSGEETGAEASFSTDLAQDRDHIGTWDVCLYAHGFGAGEGLLAEAPYVYPSPTGSITVTSHAPNALEVPGWMNAQVEVREPYSGPPGWRWWWAVTALPAGTSCPATFAPHSYIGSSTVREANFTIIPEYTVLDFPEAAGSYTLCLYVDIEDTPEAGVRLIGSGSYTFPAATPLVPSLPAKATTAPPKPKPLTRAQKLSKALKACRRDRKKSKRMACEKQARKKYGPLQKKHR